MAGRAVVHDAGMIKGGAGKIGGVMTDAAILGGGNMRCRLTPGSQFFMRSIMAGGAIAGDAVVSEDRRFKRVSIMAKMAILFRGDMVCRRIFAGGKYAVVTSVTTRCHALVIEHAGGKTGGNMAHGTVFRGGNMICRLA